MPGFFLGLNRPSLSFCLQIRHVGVDAVLFVQLFWAALLGHHAVGQHHDLFRPRHGTHLVGDDQHRLVLDQPGQRRLDQRLTPDALLTGENIQTPRGSFLVTDMSREQMEAAG